MGFVVDNHINVSDASKIKRKNQALVYGKAELMWEVWSCDLFYELKAHARTHAHAGGIPINLGEGYKSTPGPFSKVNRN